ncbi:MAG TPA: hypothetical protein VIT22_01760, partial [Pseudoxanthomonas sp.]
GARWYGEDQMKAARYLRDQESQYRWSVGRYSQFKGPMIRDTVKPLVEVGHSLATMPLGAGLGTGASVIGKGAVSVLPRLSQAFNSAKWNYWAWKSSRWTSVARGPLNATERQLINYVTGAPRVLVGRSINTQGQGFAMLDDWMAINNVNWSTRVQQVYNHALYTRAAAGQPVHVISGGAFTAGEVGAAEAGAAVSGVRNIPWWP